MRRYLVALGLVLLAGCSSLPDTGSTTFDAPDARRSAPAPFKDAATYTAALQTWRSVEDLNAWIGARFEYDRARALLLSETQRSRSGKLPIHAPAEFFAEPKGVCVDLARFAVETLRVIEPSTRPAYVMIEFVPVEIAGNTLRRHWVVSYERDGQRYFVADSKRPGHIAGPYASTQAYIDDYARYRGREIVAFREMESYERKVRTAAARQSRAGQP